MRRCAVTNKRDPFGWPVETPDKPSTLRSIEAADIVEPDEPPGPVYYEPQPLHAVSNHKTIEVETVKLAQDIDPRKAPTQMSIARPPASPLPPDSQWPQAELVAVSSQPPASARKSRMRLLGLGFLLAALALWLLRSLFAHSSANSSAAAAASAPGTRALSVLEASRLAPPNSAPLAPPIEPNLAVSATPSGLPTAPVAPLPAPARSPSEGHVASSQRVAPAPAKAAAVKPSPAISSSALAPDVTAPSKPKRAIY